MPTKIDIVIIDDHQMFLDGMILVLKSIENFNVLFAETNPIKALEKLKKCEPDIIITDISMPEMNGIEFAKIVKKKYPSIKIIVTSTHEDMHNIHNIDGYLTKEKAGRLLVETIYTIYNNNSKKYHSQVNFTSGYNFKKHILSEREKEIILLIAEEKTSEEIAEILYITKHTVDTHRKNIFLKLNVKTSAGLIKQALYLGLLK